MVSMESPFAGEIKRHAEVEMLLAIGITAAE